MIQMSLFCRVYYGFCHGMREMLFQAGCDAKQLILALYSLKETTSATVGFALVSVPVLSNTIVSASATASRNLPPLTVILMLVWLRGLQKERRSALPVSVHRRSLPSEQRVLWLHFWSEDRSSAVPPREYGTRLVCQMLCLALQSGFQFLGLFDHRGDLLITAGSAGSASQES